MPCDIAIGRRSLIVASFIVAVLSATLWGCNKDDNGMLEVFAESFGSDTKLVVNNRIAEWQDGDEIRINGTTAVIYRQVSQGETHAYIPSSAASSVNRAVYPATLCSGIGADSINIILPAEYQYKTAGGLQVLEVPMAAVSAENSPLHFRHLTGALNIRIQGRTSEDVILESVTVSSDIYQLSDTVPLNFANIGGQSAHVATTEQQKSVTLKFSGTELPANGSLDVIIPVPPVLSDNYFTITVKARREGKRYVYTRSQSGDGNRSLGRNVMGYVETALSSASINSLFEGKGTNTDYYRISSKEDFLLMVEAINNDWTNKTSRYYKESYYRLTDSIDMMGAVISPITKFTSNTIFDGNGFAIKNFTITSIPTTSTTYDCGLFSGAKAQIKNLILDNITLQHSGNTSYLYLSPLCATMLTCTVSNCTIRNVDVSISGSVASVSYGALTAYTTASVSASGCFVSGNLTNLNASGLYYGGLFGEVAATVNITNCTVENNTLNMSSSGTMFFGGIVGSISNSRVTVDLSSWHGAVSMNAAGLHAGGGVGSFATGNSGSLYITNSRFLGSFTTSISGNTLNIGKFIGRKTGSRISDFTGSTATITHNGQTVTNDIGMQ